MTARIFKFNRHNIVDFVVAENEEDAINTYKKDNPTINISEVKYKLIAGNALVSKTISHW